MTLETDKKEAVGTNSSLSLSVFYFPEDLVSCRMGTDAAYMIAISDRGEVYWIASEKDLPTQALPEQFRNMPKLPYLFDRRGDLDGSYPVSRLLNDRTPSEFKNGDLVDAGMGHWGYALGVRNCLISRE